MHEHEMLKRRFADQVFKNKKRDTLAAIEVAYADMSRRQTGHLPAMKDACIDQLVKNVFANELQITDFDTWHEEQCNALVAIWNEIKPNWGSVGKAQKVLNMAFKYLSCITDKYDNVCQNCHMTLDSYTLAWYKDIVRPWAKEHGHADVKELIEWSKINSYSEYQLIQNNIRSFLREGATYSVVIGSKTTRTIELSTVPIEAEFVIWEGQIINERYTNLIKELENYIKDHRGTPAGKVHDAWLLGELFSDYLKDYAQNCFKV